MALFRDISLALRERPQSGAPVVSLLCDVFV